MSGNATEGLVSRSPNNSDSLVNVMITDSTVGSNLGIGVRSVGQRSTVRIGGSTVSGNGAANVGVTPATPS